MPTRLCTHPGCPNHAAWRGRCPTHNRHHDQAIRRAGRPIYNTRRWKHTRLRILHDNPICAICDRELATDVHHIQDIANGGDPWNPANLAALCRACHSATTRREQQAHADTP